MLSLSIHRLACCLCIIMLCLLTSCATRPEVGFLTPINQTMPLATTHDLLVATTRQRDTRPGTYFNGERGSALDFARFTVSVPRNHVAGEIELASAAPGDPAKDFVVSKASYVDGDQAFLNELNARLANRPAGKRKVLLFVHGYNTMFAEGLYRFAQIVHDSETPAVPVLFTWASRGRVTQYVYDTNSATAARDDLDRTIRLIFASNVDEVNILAHSMGNWVTVEAMRQIKISGDLPPMQKLGAVALAAPDIDIDVFRSQMRVFGRPRKPVFIIVSRDDKALSLSSLIAGGRPRLGADANTAELAALGVVVVDMTDVKSNDSSNHGKFVELAELGPRIHDVLGAGIGGSQGSLARTNKPAGGPVGRVAAVPFQLLGGTIRVIGGR